MNIDRLSISGRTADLLYGILIAIGSASLYLFAGTWLPGATFGFGILLSYMVHVGWRMSQFDPYENVEEEIDEMKNDIEEVKEQM